MKEIDNGDIPMKKHLVPLIIVTLLLCLTGLAGAEFPFLFGPPINPYFLPLSNLGPLPMLPPVLPFGPFLSAGLNPLMSFPQPLPLRPILRQARATAAITIFFNPTQSLIQVTVLPLPPTAAIAPVVAPTVVAPTAVAPTIAPSALLFLPLLSALSTSTTTPNVNLNSTVGTPNVNVNSVAPTGLSALLPFI